MRLRTSIQPPRWTDNDVFTFEIAAIDGAPLPTSTTTSVTKRDLREDGAAAVRFGKIRFTAAGTYEYEVREQKAGTVENGLTYSTNVARIRVIVVDDGRGSLVATPALVSGSNAFVNGYGVELDYNAVEGLPEIPDFAMIFTMHRRNLWLSVAYRGSSGHRRCNDGSDCIHAGRCWQNLELYRDRECSRHWIHVRMCHVEHFRERGGRSRCGPSERDDHGNRRRRDPDVDLYV